MKITQKTFIDPNLARQFGIDYIKIITAWLLNNTVASRPGLRPYPKKATGRLVQSFNYRLRDTALAIQTEIYALDYLKYVDEGRKPGTYPPIKPLLQWARVKGLPDGVAYGAQKNIYKYGIKPTNVIKKATKIYDTSRVNNRKYEERMVNNLIKIIEKNYKAAVIKVGQ